MALLSYLVEYRIAITPLKFAHFDRREMYEHVGCRYDLEPIVSEHYRHLGRVVDGNFIDDRRQVECEVVVIGDGRRRCRCGV